MKILILASNPRKDLNLDREIRDLKDVIKKSHNRQQFEVEDALAVRVGDLQDLLLQHKPQIVHFCGHGSGEQGLVFEGNDGGEQWVRAEALSNLFRLFSKNVGCVLLNACYSEEQASAIVNHIDYVIGMNQEIRDDAAIAFSKGFYRALGYECSIEEAFEFGQNAIQLEISGSSKMRSAVTDQQRKLEVVDAVAKVVLQEHLKPILKRKPSLAQDPDRVASGSEQMLSHTKREEIQLDIAKVLTEESNFKQYREKVREFLTDRKLSKIEEIRLEQFRKDLGLSVGEANQILEEEKKPIQKAYDDYQEMLVRLIEEGNYPFDPGTEAELQQYCEELQLTEGEVESIRKPILEAAEEEYRTKQQQELQRQQEYQAKLQRYEQEFRKAITAGYPIDSYVRNGLEQFQQFLGLSDEAVTQIEAPIIAPKEDEYQQRLESEQQRREEAEQRRRQEYEDKLQRYEQEFQKVIEAQYPIESSACSKLKALQQSLELSDEVVAQIEELITAPKEAEYQRQQEQQREEQRGREEAKERSSLKVFEFQVPKLEVVEKPVEKQVEKSGLFGKRIEIVRITEKFCNITYQQGQAEYFVEDLGNGVTLEMVAIPGGTFMMGSTESSTEYMYERPQHQVTVQPFSMGKFAVTQVQWKAVAELAKVNQDLDPDPSRFKGNNRPVESVFWNEAVEFCARLSQKTGRQYRLPSEAEWEYACRARTTTPFYCGETITTDLANYNGNHTSDLGTMSVYRKQTTDVGSFPPNAFGLYDMSGNVWEWCADHWHPYYQEGPIDGSAWIIGGSSNARMVRGGSWSRNQRNCRSAARDATDLDKSGNKGFRVVCGLA